MGMFDSVIADCLNCHEKDALEFQSKSGPCWLDRFKLGSDPIPYAVIQGTGSYRKSEKCRKCGKEYSLEYEPMLPQFAIHVKLVEYKPTQGNINEHND